MFNNSAKVKSDKKGDRKELYPPKKRPVISQISIGEVLPSGSIFTSFMFFNERVDDDCVGTFMAIPTALQMALKDFSIKKAYW